MINRLIIFVQLLGYTNIQSQTIIRGQALDSMLNPIEYASVGIVNKPVGTVTDKTGSFELNLKKELLSNDDSLRISIIGYYPKQFSLCKISNQLEMPVILQEKVENLAEVFVFASKTNERTIGSDGKSLINMYVNFSMSEYSNQNLGSEIGRKFSINHKNTLLKDYRFYIAQNNYDTVRLRVNVYSIKSMKPDINLLSRNIICEVTDKRTGWINIDLSQFNILVNNDIVISIEWIYKSQRGSKLTLPIIMPTTHVHFYKYGSQNKWKWFNFMTTHMELIVNY